MFVLELSKVSLSPILAYIQEKKNQKSKQVQAFCKKKRCHLDMVQFGMLNPNTNIGKIKNGVLIT